MRPVDRRGLGSRCGRGAALDGDTHNEIIAVSCGGQIVGSQCFYESDRHCSPPPGGGPGVVPLGVRLDGFPPADASVWPSPLAPSAPVCVSRA